MACNEIEGSIVIYLLYDLQAMESKLLIGGKSIVDKTTEQERALEERRKQIAEQKVGPSNSSRFLTL